MAWSYSRLVAVASLVALCSPVMAAGSANGTLNPLPRFGKYQMLTKATQASLRMAAHSR